MSNTEMRNESADPQVQTTEVVTINKQDLSVADVSILTEAQESFYCSIPDDGTRKSKIQIYNAINSADEQLSEHTKEVLEITDVAAHPITLPDMNTGEVIQCLRIILIDKNGKTYQAVSNGVASSLQKIFAIIGKPSWKDEPVKIKPVEQKTSNNFKVLTLELVY